MPPYLFEKVESYLDVYPNRSGHQEASAGGSILEQRFPHVIETLQKLWGHPELELYFRRLTIDERGTRKGFPEEAWGEINFLMELHRAAFPYAIR